MPNLRAIEIKAFVPSKDFELSKRFYQDLGFTKASDGHGVAYFHHGHVSFLLQDFLSGAARAQPHDAHARGGRGRAWRTHVREAGIAEKYAVRVTELQVQPWRMRDFALVDPSGVLWRIAQNA